MVYLPDLNIYYLDRYPSQELIRHEKKHLEQIERYGKVGYMARWLFFQAVYGYKNNPLEIEARAAEKGG